MEMKPVFITILQIGLEVNFGGLICIICLQALLQDGCKEEFNQNCCVKMMLNSYGVAMLSID